MANLGDGFTELVAAGREQLNEYRAAWQGDDLNAVVARKLIDNVAEAMEIVIDLPEKGSHFSPVIAQLALANAGASLRILDELRSLSTLRV